MEIFTVILNLDSEPDPNLAPFRQQISDPGGSGSGPTTVTKTSCLLKRVSWGFNFGQKTIPSPAPPPPRHPREFKITYRL
jgi:hypothetical protein